MGEGPRFRVWGLSVEGLGLKVPGIPEPETLSQSEAEKGPAKSKKTRKRAFVNFQLGGRFFGHRRACWLRGLRAEHAGACGRASSEFLVPGAED